MSNVKFNALASLALLAGAPVVAQAEMVEMAETELSDVNGQGIISDSVAAVFGALTDPLFQDPTVTNLGSIKTFTDANNNGIFDAGDTVLTRNDAVTVKDGNYLPATIGGAVGGAINNGIGNGIGFGLLPFTGPITALGNFNSQILGNSATAGKQIGDIAFAPIFKPIALAKQGVDTALNYAFFPISAPLKVAENVFTNLNNGVVGTSTRILTAPINAVINPVNRVLDTAANIGKKPVNAVLNPINNAVADVAFLASGVAKGVEFSFVGALGGATTKVLAAGATATNSRLLYNMTIASNQARLLRQQSIGKPLNVNVSVPTVDFN